MVWLVLVLLGLMIIDAGMSAYKTMTEDRMGLSTYAVATAIAALIAFGYVVRRWL